MTAPRTPRRLAPLLALAGPGAAPALAATGAAYDPTRYAAHTGGVFFVAVEGTGTLYL